MLGDFAEMLGDFAEMGQLASELGQGFGMAAICRFALMRTTDWNFFATHYLQRPWA